MNIASLFMKKDVSNKGAAGDINVDLRKLSDEEYEEIIDYYHRVCRNNQITMTLLSELINIGFSRACISDEEQIEDNNAKELFCHSNMWRPGEMEIIISRLLEVL